MEDREVRALCRMVYQKHRKAVEGVFENRADRASEVIGILMDLVHGHAELIPEHCRLRRGLQRVLVGAGVWSRRHGWRDHC